MNIDIHREGEGWVAYDYNFSAFSRFDHIVDVVDWALAKVKIGDYYTVTIWDPEPKVLWDSMSGGEHESN